MQPAATKSPASGFFGWLTRTLVLGLGGAGLAFAALYAANAVLPTMLGGRIVGPSTGNTLVGGLSVVLFGLGIVALLLLRTLWPPGRSCGVIIGWWGLFFAFVVVGQIVHGLSLGQYLLGWLAVGAVWSLILGRERPTANRSAPNRGAVAVARVRGQPLPPSQFGRVPPQTVALIKSHLAAATAAANSLPAGVPAEIGVAATTIVLDHLLEDWWKNKNTEGLSDDDVADLPAFVRLAWQQAAPIEELPLQIAVFRAVLTGLMGDWLANWNANNVAGPPHWQTQQAKAAQPRRSR